MTMVGLDGVDCDDGADEGDGAVIMMGDDGNEEDGGKEKIKQVRIMLMMMKLRVGMRMLMRMMMLLIRDDHDDDSGVIMTMGWG